MFLPTEQDGRVLPLVNLNEKSVQIKVSSLQHKTLNFQSHALHLHHKRCAGQNKSGHKETSVKTHIKWCNCKKYTICHCMETPLEKTWVRISSNTRKHNETIKMISSFKDDRRLCLENIDRIHLEQEKQFQTERDRLFPTRLPVINTAWNYINHTVVRPEFNQSGQSNSWQYSFSDNIKHVSPKPKHPTRFTSQ
jgi:hypothetical protein